MINLGKDILCHTFDVCCGQITGFFYHRSLFFLQFTDSLGVQEVHLRTVVRRLVSGAEAHLYQTHDFYQHHHVRSFLQAYVQKKPLHNMHLDRFLVCGTPFQKQVWRMLLTIPYGSTWSYKQLAVTAKVPGSWRAVAQAVGANPLILLLPCHRVVGSYSLGGYSSGLERKLSLLNHEQRK